MWYLGGAPPDPLVLDDPGMTLFFSSASATPLLSSLGLWRHSPSHCRISWGIEPDGLGVGW
jgi:hypothetical protein